MTRQELIEAIMESDWIKGAIKHPGAFKAEAERRKMTTDQLAADVKNNPGKYGTKMKRRAALARTLKKFRSKG